MVVVLLQQRSTRKRVGATGTTLTIAEIVLGAGAAALAVLMLRGNVMTIFMPAIMAIIMTGMLTSSRIRSRYRNLGKSMQHRRTAQREGQHQGKYKTRRGHVRHTSTRARHRQTAILLLPIGF